MEIFYYINVQTILLLLLCFIGCYFYLTRQRDLPPGPWRLPVIGSAIWMFRTAKSQDTIGTVLMKASEEYGDLLYVKVFNKGLLFVQGYDAIREFFVTHGDTFSDRPHWLMPKYASKDGHRGLLFESGKNAQLLRDVYLQNKRQFGVGGASLADKITTEAEAASAVLQGTKGEPFDIRDLAHFTAFNVIHSVVFGKRCEYDAVNRNRLQDALESLFKNTGAFDLSSRLPNFILKLIGRNKVKEWNSRIDIHNAIREYISEEISQHEATFDEDSINDFVDLCIQNKRSGRDADLFNDDNAFHLIRDILTSGSEPMANTILWFIIYMIEHTDVQKKCQDELLKVCGNNTIRWSDRDKLAYVEATIMEVQRVANHAEITMFHTNLAETTMRGYTIPERTVVLANLPSACLDPRHWDNPREFSPDRFLKDGKLTSNPACIPFGIGPRMCIGESLARMELFLLFSHLLQKFTFKRENDDVPISFKRDTSKIGGVPMPFKMRAIPRS